MPGQRLGSESHPSALPSPQVNACSKRIKEAMAKNSHPDPSLEVRIELAEIARRMFDRKLLDMAGGNLSARCGENIVISPRYAGSKKHWQLKPEDFIEGRIDSDDLLEDPRFSREGKAHLAIYRTLPIVNGVIHAHAFHVLPFAAQGKPIPPVLEGTQKFGTVPVAPYAPTQSAELAANAVQLLKVQEGALRAQAAAVILPTHGILIAGKDIWAAADALEQIDWNAWCLIAGKLLD
ncbi:MAG: class II aldolase/adducin family protein [Chloroflexi bacterium]|nr:class II aldolase/adducin family protein [Chloroflexota bacterium]